MRVLLVEPEKAPVIAKIDDTLEAMQKVVGGYIEVVYPFDDHVALVCNEEGKLSGLPLNRALYAENGEVYDIIAGTFFLCGAPVDSEHFKSLTCRQIRKFTKRFAFPEMFVQTDSGIDVVSFSLSK